MKPKILLVNDDGIHAPGLKAAWQALQGRADLTICAPSSQRSGAGTSITMYHPLHLEHVEWPGSTPAYSLSGTPADCVKIALGDLLDSPPDLILSGVNNGVNAGRNVFYSGTVGATVEAALRNLPALALSIWEGRSPCFDRVGPILNTLVEYLLENPLPPGTLLNANLPPHEKEIRGFRLGLQGRSYWRETPFRREHPEGFPYYWLGGEQATPDEAKESDMRLLKEGYVTGTPIRVVDLTCHKTLKEHSHLFSALEATIAEHH